MEIPLGSAAKVISHMDSDDAVDILEEMDDSSLAALNSCDADDIIGGKMYAGNN